MMFEVRAFNAAGQEVRERVEAVSAAEAQEVLRRRGMFVAGAAVCDATEGATRAAGRSSGKLPGGLIVKQLAVFSRELSLLVATGTPVVDGLAALERQASDDRWRTVVRGVRERVEGGEPLSDAMAAFPHVFTGVARSLVAAGESAGALDVMLDRLASLTRRQARTRGAITGALVYPALLISVSVLVLMMLIMFVLPRFSGLFETLDTGLPPTTQALVWVSDTLRAWWFIAIPLMLGAVGGAIYWARTPAGVRTIGDVALRLPRFNAILRSFQTARITRLLGTLLEGRVPMLEALQLTRGSVSHHRYVALLGDAEQAVSKGEPVSVALAGNGLLVPSAVEAMRNGEQTGRLSTVLCSVADYLDEENEAVLKSLSSLIEPLIMLGLGALVAFVAVSMFLPLFDLTASAGGGAP
ncbi:MAG: type II secretion system F family protein [Planctomycetota bacterium]